MKNRINIFTLWLLLAAVAFGQTANVQKGAATNNLTGSLNTGTQTITANDGGTITYSGTGAINAKTLQTYTPATLPVSTAAQTALDNQAAYAATSPRSGILNQRSFLGWFASGGISLTGESNTGFVATSSGGGNQYVQSGTFVLNTGDKLIVECDASALSGSIPSLQIYDLRNNVGGTVTGSFSNGHCFFTITVPSFSDQWSILVSFGSNAGSITISNIAIYDSLRTQNIIQDTLPIFGLEYRSAWSNLLFSKITSAPVIVFTGDSTTYGTDLVDPTNNTIDKVVASILAPKIGAVDCVNRGQPSRNTNDWINATANNGGTPYLTGDLALNPKVMVIRWGVNDGSQDGTGTLASFESNLRAGLATIRKSRGVDDLTLILCTPNSTYEPTGSAHRGQSWHYYINAIIRKAARDYQCVFVDTYQLYNDSKNAEPWMDTYNDTDHIHPLDVWNRWFGGVLAGILYSGEFSQFQNDVRNYDSIYRDPSVGWAPADFGFGIEMDRAQLGNGWPSDGAVITFTQHDGVSMQFNLPYGNTGEALFRTALTSGSWGDWSEFGSSIVRRDTDGGVTIVSNAANAGVYSNTALLALGDVPDSWTGPAAFIYYSKATSTAAVGGYNRTTSAYIPLAVNPGGRTLVNKTTDDGTHALQVHGTSIFDSAITATGGVTGNASTATTLQTSRNINGVGFDGSANVTIPVHVVSYSTGVLTIQGDDGHQYTITATQL